MPQFIQPSQITFIHKKYDDLPTAFLINHEFGEFVEFEWTGPLTVYDVTPTNFKVGLTSSVNNLAAGTHNLEVVVSEGDGDGYGFSDKLFITLNLAETLKLSVSPSSTNFQFTVGGTTPSNQLVTVSSEYLWSVAKNASWVVLSATSGSQNGSFSIGVNPTGLAPGIYNDTVTVDDEDITKDITITLTVSDPNTGSDYLNIYPVAINYGFTEGGALPPAKNIDVNSSDNYTIAATKTWIGLSTTTGTAGNNTLNVFMQNLSALAVGEHIGFIDFTLASIVKRVTVILTIYELITETLLSGNLYFADDDNLIKVSSGRNDTKLVLEVNTNFEGKTYNVPYNIPFFNGVAKKRIGDEVNNIIKDRELFGTSGTQVISPYAPAVLNIGVNEVETETDSVLQTSFISNVRFMRGREPFGNINNLPRTVFLTKTGILLFSVLGTGTSSGNLTLTGSVNQVKNGLLAIYDFYTVILPLYEFDLEPGDAFTATLLNESINIVIIDRGVDQSFIYSETEWGTFEVFECTGEVEEIVNFNNKTFDFRKDHHQNETKVYDRKQRNSYKINTGYLTSEEMVDYLVTILKGKNVYLQTSTGTRKVENTTKKVNIRETLRENRELDLTFEDVLE